MVVFTNNEEPFRKNCLRDIKIKHFGYLIEGLKDGFPYYVWKRDEDETNQREELFQMIHEVSEKIVYAKHMFVKAQEVYILNLIKRWKESGRLKRNFGVSAKTQLVKLGVPDILFGRYFTDPFMTSLERLVNSS